MRISNWDASLFSHPGSQTGRWDHSMLLQTPSTSVPVMVSTILLLWVARTYCPVSLPSVSGDTPRDRDEPLFTGVKTCPCRRDTALGAAWACGLGWEARTWCPAVGGGAWGLCQSLLRARTRTQCLNLVPGRWELGARMGACGWGEEDKKQGHEGGLEAV